MPSSRAASTNLWNCSGSSGRAWLGFLPGLRARVTSMTECRVSGVGEDFTERLERLGCRLSEINQRWHDRLVLNKVVLAEEYLNGRLTLVGELAIVTAE